MNHGSQSRTYSIYDGCVFSTISRKKIYIFKFFITTASISLVNVTKEMIQPKYVTQFECSHLYTDKHDVALRKLYRCTPTIYWFSASLRHCMEKGNVEWNANTSPPPPKKNQLCRNLNNEIYAKVKIGKHLYSECKVIKSVRQRDAIPPVLANCNLKS